MAAAVARPASTVGRIEGAFNRCIMRIAQALKDPSTYGDSTKPFLQECALKFHDALDDCEVQILDAKWYLEHQLALNKARRAARAREEEGLATQKRKLDQIQEEDQGGDAEDTREDGVKRVRLESAENAGESQPEVEANQAQPPKASHSEEADEPSTKPEAKQPEDQQPEAPSLQPPNATGQTPAQSSPQQLPPVVTTTAAATATADNSAPGTAASQPQSAVQVPSAAANDDFNFVSMFEGQSQDGGHNLDGIDNDDLNFDLALGDDFATTTTTAAPSSSDQAARNGQSQVVGDANANGDDSQGRAGEAFDSLGLDGLDALANQSQSQNQHGDGGSQSASNNNNDKSNNNNNHSQEDISFNLPLNGPNEFDILLNEGFDTGRMDADANFGQEDLNMDLDFDSMFNDP